MTTVTVVSDLHLEGRNLSLDQVLDPDLASDVLCLLGDIGDPGSQTYRDFLSACASRFPTVLLLAGNNEYRNHDGGGRTMAQMEELIRLAVAPHPNVHFLQNQTHVVDNVAFIGTTLWSYLPDDPLPRQREEGGTGASIPAAAPAAVATEAEAAGTAAVGAIAVVAAAEAGPSPPVPSQPAALALPVSPPSVFSTAVAPFIDYLTVTVVQPSQQQQQQQQFQASIGKCERLERQNSSLLTLGLKESGRRPSSPRPDALSAAGSWAAYAAEAAAAVAAVAVAASKAESAMTDATPSPGAVGLTSTMPTTPSTFSTSPTSTAVASRRWARSGAGSRSRMSVAHSQPPPLSYLIQAQMWVNGGGVGSSSQANGTPDCGMPYRRLRLRHSVSLSSLLPEDPCPPWTFSVDRGSSSDEVDGSSDGGGIGRCCDRGGAESSSGGSSSSSDDCNSHSDGTQEDSEEVDEEDSSAVSGGSMAGSAPENGSGCRTAAVRHLPGSTFCGGGGHGKTPGVVGMGSQRASTAALGSDTAALPSQDTSHSDAESPTRSSCPATVLPSALSDGNGTTASAASASFGAAVGAPCLSEATPSPEPIAAPSSSPRAHPHHHHRRQHHHHHHHPYHHHAHTLASPLLSPPAPATIREFISATSLDFRRIFTTPGGPAITPDVTNALFIASVDYIRAAVAAARARGLTPVVLSHHAPSMRGTCRPQFAEHPSTHAYGTDLESYIEGSGIAEWYCGHTHYNFDMEMQGGTRLASNQFGSQQQPGEGYNRAWQHRLLGRLAPGAAASATACHPPQWAAEPACAAED